MKYKQYHIHIMVAGFTAITLSIGLCIQMFSASHRAELLPCAINPPFQPLVYVSSQSGLRQGAEKIRKNKGGTLCLAAGIYNLTAGSQQRTDLYFENMYKLAIVGEGPETIIRLADVGGQPQVRAVFVNGATNLIVRNLTIDGNRAAFQWNLVEQQNNLMIRNANARVSNVTLINAHGDCINTGDGSLYFENSFCDGSDRNGLTLGAGEHRDVKVIGVTFGADIDTQQIDLEHGKGSGLEVRNSTFRRFASTEKDRFAITVVNHHEFVIASNVIENDMLIRGSAHGIVRDNTGIGQLTIDRGSRDIIVDNNSFLSSGSWHQMNQNWAVIMAREVAGQPVSDLRFTNNLVRVSGVPRAFFFENVDNIAIRQNTIRYEPSNDMKDTVGITLRAITRNMNTTLMNNTYENIQEDVEIEENDPFRVILTGSR